jgi:hypothetical protein
LGGTRAALDGGPTTPQDLRVAGGATH